MSRDELLLTIIRNEVCCVCVHKPTSIEEGLTKDSPKTHKGTGCTYNYDEDSGLYCQLAIKCANQILAKAKQHYELQEGYVVMAAIEEAKKQERERIIDYLKEHNMAEYLPVTGSLDGMYLKGDAWQALQGLEEG